MTGVQMEVLDERAKNMVVVILFFEVCWSEKDESCLTIQLFPTVSIAFQSLFTSRESIYGRSHALFRTHA